MVQRIIPYSIAGAGVNMTDPELIGTVSKSFTSVYGSGFNPDAKIRAALKKWGDVCGIVFARVGDPGTAFATGTWPLLRIFCATIDGNVGGLNVQGKAWYPGSSAKAYNVVIEDDPTDALGLKMSAGSGYTYFDSLMVHELGHALMSMGHNTNPGSVMNGIGTYTPNSNDQWVAQYHYGTPNTTPQKVGQDMPLGVIYSLYRGAYNQNPDLEGLTFWVNAIASGTQSLLAVSNAVVGNLSSLTNDHFINNVYSRVLNRVPTSAENLYWQGQITATSRAAVLLAIANSAEAATRRQSLFPTNLWFTQI